MPEPIGPATAAMPAYADIPRINVTLAGANLAPGYLFMCPQSIMDQDAPHGPQIVDDQGRPVWFFPIPKGQFATDVRVQEYRGEPVITWWQGEATKTGAGKGACYIADRHYRIIDIVRAGGEHGLDLHEFLLTDRGTALVVSYQVKPWDLSPLGGPEDGEVLDSVVEEIDVATGEVLLHWSGVEQIPLTESDIPVMMAAGGPYDHLHVNAVGVDDDDNLVITARSSSAFYKVDRRTGDVLWKYGSGYSTLRLDTGARCFWPHDARPAGGGVYRVFDNGTNDYMEGYETRIVWVRADADTGIASYVRHIVHPERLSSLREGNSQELPNGNVLVGWGGEGRISEFAANGTLLFDARMPGGPGWSTYRVYRDVWDGRPLTPPEAIVDGTQVHALWNGATGVAQWRLLAGSSEADLATVETASWEGLSTTIELPSTALPQQTPGYVQVQALDADGEVIGTSSLEPVGSNGG